MDPLAIVGAQSYSFRQFDFQGALEQLSLLGLNLMEFCAVHFPPDPDAPILEPVAAAMHSRDVCMPCYGVEEFTDDAAANRRKFLFAHKMGARYISANPTPDAFASLEALVEEFDIRIAIHNHGPGARYDKVSDTLQAVRKLHPHIGACVDTGHVLRSGEQPHDVIEGLGERVHCLHLKDWKRGGEEAAVGEGDLDLVKTVAALRSIHFSGFICMEYELEPEAPVIGMQRGLRNWLGAVKA